MKMWFKNLQVFRLIDDLPYTAEQLNDRLAEKICPPCPKSSPSSYGWVSPFGEDSDVIVHGLQGYLLFAAGRQERILPASVINDRVLEKVKAIEARESRKVYGSEKKRLKDEVIFDLLPQAFTRQKITYAYLDPKNNCLLIDCSSHNPAEELTKLLRHCLGSLNLLPPITKSKPAVLMTDWLERGHCPGNFEFSDTCQLIEPKSGKGIIKCDKQDLGASAVLAHLKAGKQVTKLGLIWQNRLSFVLNEDLSLSRIRPLEIIEDRAEGDMTPEQILDQDFAIMTGEFSELLSQLFTAFDGLEAV